MWTCLTFHNATHLYRTCYRFRWASSMWLFKPLAFTYVNTLHVFVNCTLNRFYFWSLSFYSTAKYLVINEVIIYNSCLRDLLCMRDRIATKPLLSIKSVVLTLETRSMVSLLLKQENWVKSQPSSSRKSLVYFRVVGYPTCQIYDKLTQNIPTIVRYSKTRTQIACLFLLLQVNKNSSCTWNGVT